ncbi:OmpA family protein [Flavobacterium sp. 20NA77.7]|uniref:OmpA family protein n=1 Tax=Flavobacterium nakdongensis TaxID=3073563 RepID=A0ABY9RB09_9FLAO|nr:OmpA family protein [Flavobacterium sp. 20NA77.7]WMW77790.1 OmpA family protein [Flavobacterium sp. 20NA77.7]
MKKITTIAASLILITTVGFAQEKKVAIATKNYDNLAYVDAVKVYKRVAEKGYKSVEVFQKLANAYYFQANLEEAAKWYGELFLLTQDLEPEYFIRYAQSLKSVGDYTKADEIMTILVQKGAKDTRAALFVQNKDYQAQIKKNSGRQEIKNAGFNSEYSDYGTAINGDQLIFSSTRETAKVFKRKHSWTNQSFTNLYVLKSTSSTPELLNSKINSAYNESTPVFTKDGKTMYFTRNNYFKGRTKTDQNKIVLLKLYKATFDGKKWSKVEELPFNSNEYSCAHPALSTDEKTLYFASNMPGTVGQSDIFKVAIRNNGTFGTPENLGKTINTEGRETFPFIAADSKLYFASDGHVGLGGLDVFVSEITAQNSYTEPQNVGAPVNSGSDDFGYVVDATLKSGYFTSNRKQDNLGFDDIYSFTEKKALETTTKIQGQLTDASTGEVIQGKVILFDNKYNKVAEVQTDAMGNYIFENVPKDQQYYVRAESVSYATNEAVAVSDQTKTTLTLTKQVKTLKVGDDLRSALNIDIIYFDLDKSNIREDATVELAKIAEVLHEYPTMKIAICSHTDSRQTHQYNQVLSDKRAQSTRDWLISKGIAPERLTAKGYGETELLNVCADGVLCAESDHQKNRRSEFIIMAN